MSDDQITLDDIRLELIKIENRMDRSGGWNLHDRWKSGRLLVAMRNKESGYLPKGRLTTVAATLKTSTRELSDRMRVADTYPTDASFRKAARGRTWTGLLRTLPITREARTGSTRPAKNHMQMAIDALAHLIADKQLDTESLRLAQKLYDRLADQNV